MLQLYSGPLIYKNDIEIGEGMGQQGKKYGELVGMVNLMFCYDYNAPTLLRNLRYRSLGCRQRGTLQTRYPPWFTIRFSV